MSTTPVDQPQRSRQNSLRISSVRRPTIELSRSEAISTPLSPTTSNSQLLGATGHFSTATSINSIHNPVLSLTHTTPSSPLAAAKTQLGSALNTDLLTLNNPPVDDKDLRHNIFGKVTGLLQKSLLSSRDAMEMKDANLTVTLKADHISRTPTNTSPATPVSPIRLPRSLPMSRTNSPVKETNRVFLEYDPISRRKVLNTYEILREIGRGEHGKVKLAKDLVNKDLVAIKIVNRNKKERPQLRMRNLLKPAQENEYELKIKREIAIMKKCMHKHIVQLREVLDDFNTHKIYLVLEYLEKGEVRWKRVAGCNPDCDSDQIPCGGMKKGSTSDSDLLSNDYAPNLTFKQSRKVFRDVLLGLEYLHLQGIVHRDIKPANLLVSSDNTVKISDFGVSFASSLDDADAGLLNELELAKTAGTPAFFAPEMCQTNFSSSRSSSQPSSRHNSKSGSVSSLEVLRNELTLTKVLPRIDYKIDIWALGVTFYCLLFGKLPFNAESEYNLFQVIVNNPLEFPPDKDSFNSPSPVLETEFELARDLLSKLLDKNPESRIEIKDIKEHPFVLMDLDDDLDALHELLYLNDPESNPSFLSSLDLNSLGQDKVTKEEIDNAVIGIGARIKKSIVNAITSGARDHDIRKKFLLSMEPSSSINSSSDESTTASTPVSRYTIHPDHSVILSEGQAYSSPLSKVESENTNTQNLNGSTPPFLTSNTPRSSSHTLAGIKDGRFQNPILNDVIEAEKSAGSSRRGSSAGANEIETKRNVVGDLYLKNQSIVDTFKGIQELDDKRRRSSAFSSSVPPTNPSTAKNSISSHTGVNESSPAQPINIPGLVSFDSSAFTPKKMQHTDTSSTLKHESAHSQIIVGPINENEERRVSSVMSLPLTESFASLDSINDDYLSFKYKEFFDLKLENKNNSDGNVDVDTINKQFQSFNLGNLMNNYGISFNFAKRDTKLDEIAPKTIVKDKNIMLSTSSSSCSSSSYSENDGPRVKVNPLKKSFVKREEVSGSESDEDSDSEEDGNLTLAFTSRIAPARPKFLTMDQRAKSHDSSLPNLNRSQPRKQIPVVFPHGDEDLEDVPAVLMGNVPRPSISIVPTLPDSNSTTSDPSPMDFNTSVPSKNTSGGAVRFDLGPVTGVKQMDDRRPSPLMKDAPFSDNATANSHLYSTSKPSDQKNGLVFGRNYDERFHNHYKKDPIVSPFPNAIHNETDRESKQKTDNKDEIRGNPARPYNYRSNSITIGLLQHES